MKNKKTMIKGVILLLLLLIVIGSISMYAWAKYISSKIGSAEAQVAKWSFKVVDGDVSTIDVLDFPITRTDENNKVDRNTIAPRNMWKISNRYRC